MRYYITAWIINKGLLTPVELPLQMVDFGHFYLYLVSNWLFSFGNICTPFIVIKVFIYSEQCLYVDLQVSRFPEVSGNKIFKRFLQKSPRYWGFQRFQRLWKPRKHWTSSWCGTVELNPEIGDHSRNWIEKLLVPWSAIRHLTSTSVVPHKVSAELTNLDIEEFQKGAMCKDFVASIHFPSGVWPLKFVR